MLANVLGPSKMECSYFDGVDGDDAVLKGPKDSQLLLLLLLLLLLPLLLLPITMMPMQVS